MPAMPALFPVSAAMMPGDERAVPVPCPSVRRAADEALAVLDPRREVRVSRVDPGVDHGDADAGEKTAADWPGVEGADLGQVPLPRDQRVGRDERDAAFAPSARST